MTLRHRLYGIGHKDLRRAHKLWAVVYRACARTSPPHHVTGSWLASPWTAVISYSSQKHCCFGDGPTPLSGHENLTFKWPRRRQRGPFCFRLNFWEAWKNKTKKCFQDRKILQNHFVIFAPISGCWSFSKWFALQLDYRSDKVTVIKNKPSQIHCAASAIRSRF